MITVRIPIRDFVDCHPLDIERKFIEAGMPPADRRAGMMRRYMDSPADVAVFEYIPQIEVVN